MATLSVQSISRTGLAPVYEAAGEEGDKLRPGRGVFLHIRNAGVTAATVTLVTPGTVDGDLGIEDREVAVPGEDEVMVAVPERDGQGRPLYGDPADGGLATVTYSDETDLTVAALRA
jgi:hypothetical protein